MKSFDSRLENDLFPKTPAVFDQMVKQTIKDVCAQSDAPQSEVQQTAVERSWTVENGKQRIRKPISTLKRIGLIAAASVLAVCFVAVGMVAFLARSARTLPAAPGQSDCLPEVITSLEQYEGDSDFKVDFVYAFNLPADNNEFQSGTADKSDFVNYLKNVNWELQEAPEQSLSNRGWMEFFLGSIFDMKIYKEECIAVVSHNGEINYYKTGSGDYEAALALFRISLISNRDDFKILNVDTQTESGKVTFTVHYTASVDGYWYLWYAYPNGGGAGCEGEFSKDDSSFSFTVSAEEELNRYSGEVGGRVQGWDIYLSSVNMLQSRDNGEVKLFDSWNVGDRSFFENFAPDFKPDDFEILDVETTKTQSGEVTFTVHYNSSVDGYWYLWNAYPNGGGASHEGEFSKDDSSFSFTVSAEEELNRYDGQAGGRVQGWDIYLSSEDMVHSVNRKKGLFDLWHVGDRSFFESIAPDAKLTDYETFNILSVEKAQAQSGEVTFIVNYSSSVDGYWCLMCNYENGGYPVQRRDFSKGASSFSVTVSAEEELKRFDGSLGGKVLSWDIELHSDLGDDQNVRLYDSEHVADRSFFEKIAPNVVPGEFEILDVETTQSPSGEVTFTVHYNSSVDGYWYFICAGMNLQDELGGVFSKGESSFSFTASAEEELNRTCEVGKVQEWEIYLSSDDIIKSSRQPLMTDSRIIDRSFFENIVSEQKGK